MAARPGDDHLRVLPDGRLQLELDDLTISANAERWLHQLLQFHAAQLTTAPSDRLGDVLGEFDELRLSAPPDTGGWARLVARSIIDATAHLLERRHDRPRHLVELVHLPLADQALRVRLSRRITALGDLLLLEEFAEQLSYDSNAGTDDAELDPVVRFSVWLLSLWLPPGDHRRALQQFTGLDDQAQQAALALMEDWDGPDTEFLDVADRLTRAGFLLG